MMELGKKIGLLVLILGLIALSSVFVALFLAVAGGIDSIATGNVAVIPLTGIISTAEGDWLSGDTSTPDQLSQWLEDANNDKNIQAIVIEINTPGGSAVASDEIGQAVRNVDKPVIALIREVGASGGYWVASNADHIIANRMSITGSVGVTASYIGFAGTLERYNATYEEFTGGNRKELGNPFKEMSDEEREVLQRKIDTIHEFFLEEVQMNRNLSNETMKKVRTGEFFLGVEAYNLGLVDELGSWNELDAYLNQTLGEEPQYVYYYRHKTFLEELGAVRASLFPQADSGLAIRT